MIHYLCACLIFVSWTTIATAQTNPISARLKFALSKQATNSSPAKVSANRDVHLVFQLSSSQPNTQFLEFAEYIFEPTGDLFTAKIPQGKLNAFLNTGNFKRIDLAKKFKLANNRAAEHVGVNLLHNGIGSLEHPLKGKGVIIGIIDSGIDFRHMDFRTGNHGEESRILYIWDQADSFGPTPSTLHYGSEWTQADIEAQLAQPQANLVRHRDKIGHGTHVAGTAAGNGTAVGEYTGMAPEADLIVVALNLKPDTTTFSTHVINAVKYIFGKADELGKPVVINASITTHESLHDGNSLEEQTIDALLLEKNGRAFCAAAGNQGENNMHWGGFLLERNAHFTYITDNSPFRDARKVARLQFHGVFSTTDFSNTYIGFAADSLQASMYTIVDLTEPEWYTVAELIKKRKIHHPFYAKDGRLLGRLSLVANQISDSQVEFIGAILDTMQYNLWDSPKIDVETWQVFAKGSGLVHIWFDAAYDIDDRDMTIANQRYRPLDNQFLVGVPATGKHVIAVGAYTNQSTMLNFLGEDVYFSTSPGTMGARSIFSSIGPATDGRIKPELLAPGHHVVSSRSSDMYISPLRFGVLAPGLKHVLNSGTSMATPVVTGAVALYLAHHPNASILQLREAFLSSCVSDGFTGQDGLLPNQIWGYGKLDAFAAVSGDALPGHRAMVTDSYQLFQNYPNPFNPKTDFQIFLPEADIVTLDVYDTLGKRVTRIADQEILQRGTHVFSFNANELSSGVYFYHIKTQHFSATKKMILLR